MLNLYVGVGRLARDPETRSTATGTTICNLTIACDSGFGDKRETWWTKTVAFGKTAEFCQNYLKKGDVVAVVGRVSERKWQDKDGNDRYSTEVVADRIQSIKGGSGDGAERQQGAPAASSRPPLTDDGDDLDLPF